MPDVPASGLITDIDGVLGYKDDGSIGRAVLGETQKLVLPAGMIVKDTTGTVTGAAWVGGLDWYRWTGTAFEALPLNQQSFVMASDIVDDPYTVLATDLNTTLVCAASGGGVINCPSDLFSFNPGAYENHAANRTFARMSIRFEIVTDTTFVGTSGTNFWFLDTGNDNGINQFTIPADPASYGKRFELQAEVFEDAWRIKINEPTTAVVLP